MNPAREVKTERFSRTEGKTPAFVEGESPKASQRGRDNHTHGLRDRALLATLAYTFARIGSVVNLKVEDYYPSRTRFLLRFKEKGGKEKEAWRSNITLFQMEYAVSGWKLSKRCFDATPAKGFLPPILPILARKTPVVCTQPVP